MGQPNTEEAIMTASPLGTVRQGEESEQRSREIDLLTNAVHQLGDTLRDDDSEELTVTLTLPRGQIDGVTELLMTEVEGPTKVILNK